MDNTNNPQPPIWDGKDRRTQQTAPGYDLYLHLHQEIKHHQEAIFDELRTHTAEEMRRYKDILEEMKANAIESQHRHEKLSQLLSDNIAELKTLSDNQKTLITAFPKGLDGVQTHNTFHQKEEDSEKTKSEIWVEIKKKVISGTVWGALVIMAYAMWDWVKIQLGK